jgi:hypothetical protein
MAIDFNAPSQVRPYANLGAFPATGAVKTIYIAEDTNYIYRWNGTAYIEISVADLVGYVPYTGATQDVNLGNYDAYVSKLWLYDAVNDNYGSVHFTDTDFHIEDADGHKMLVIEDGFMQIHKTDTIQSNLYTSGLTATRDHYLPDASGTIALTSDLSSYVPTSRTISTTSPLSGGGDLSVNRTLSIAKATTLVDGYLSATDWTTFNGKQPLLVSGTNIKTVNGTTILGSGDLTISMGITIGTTAITSGTVGQILFQGTGNVVQESANLFWDNTNGRLGIGTSTPTVALDIVGAGKFSTTLEVTSTAGITMGGGAKSLSWTGNILEIGNSATWNDVRLYAGAVQKFSQTSSLTTISNTTINLSTTTVQLAGVSALAYSGADVRIGSVTAGFTSLSLYTAGTEKMRIAATTGNVLINTTTDAGFKLDVNGTMRVTGKTSLNGQLDTNQTGSGHAFIKVNDNGTVIRISNWNIGNLSGNVFVGGSEVASALFALNSTTLGFLPPRMTTTQKNAIASPAEGLQVWDTTLKLMSVYNGTTWITL